MVRETHVKVMMIETDSVVLKAGARLTYSHCKG